jgi:hypothetical protein
MLNNARGWKVVIVMLFFSIFSCCTKSGDQPKKKKKKVSLKSVYKKNTEEENLGILLHVGEPLGPIS